MWLSLDDTHGYRLWFKKPKLDFNDKFCHSSYPTFVDNVYEKEPPHPVSLNYFDEPENGRMIEDIFIKLDGTEMEVSTCVKVNLVEDDLAGVDVRDNLDY